MATKKKTLPAEGNTAEMKWLMLMIKIAELVDKNDDALERLEKEGKGNGVMYQMSLSALSTLEYIVNIMQELETAEAKGELNIHFVDKDGNEITEEDMDKKAKERRRGKA